MFFLDEIHLEMHLHSTLIAEFACPPYPKMLLVFQLRVNWPISTELDRQINFIWTPYTWRSSNETVSWKPSTSPWHTHLPFQHLPPLSRPQYIIASCPTFHFIELPFLTSQFSFSDPQQMQISYSKCSKNLIMKFNIGIFIQTLCFIDSDTALNM